MSVLEKIKKFVTEHGYELFDGFLRHTCGIPSELGILLKVTWSPVDGESVIKVTPTRAYFLVCRFPLLHNNWEVWSVREYKTKEELLEILEEWIRKPLKGCWSE